MSRVSGRRKSALTARLEVTGMARLTATASTTIATPDRGGRRDTHAAPSEPLHDRPDGDATRDGSERDQRQQIARVVAGGQRCQDEVHDDEHRDRHGAAARGIATDPGDQHDQSGRTPDQQRAEGPDQ